jgi:hypothetical protein
MFTTGNNPPFGNTKRPGIARPFLSETEISRQHQITDKAALGKHGSPMLPHRG